MNYLKLLLLLMLSNVLINSSFAMIEVSGNFDYKKQVYGDQRQNKSVERSYEASIAFYMFLYTALEFNYNYDQEIIIENDEVEDVNSGITILSKDSRLNTKTYGVGLRQALASPMGSFVPSFAFGYAYQIKNGGVTYKLRYSGEESTLYFPYTETKGDAVWAVFTLKIKLTKFLSINGSIKTVFEAYEWNKAKDDLRYQAGFSWYL